MLAAATGQTNIEIGAALGCQTVTAGKWRRRLAEQRLDGLSDEPCPGAPRTISDEQVEAVIVKTLEQQPRHATHWSTRSVAAEMGMSQSVISMILRAFGLKPHLLEHFRLSPDPQFIDKVRDVAGLYRSPLEAAVVLCVDEKTQMQALDRTAPTRPMLPGVPRRQAHGYVRHGVTNLYAALDGLPRTRCGVASAHVIADLSPQPYARESRRTFESIDRCTPDDLAVHVVLYNVVTHHPAASQRHPRFTLRCILTDKSLARAVSQN